ncbi:MAG: phosphotransferase, partial [Bacteroidales bacterium]|nr:phosphotransferase [Bacteroidales bacterium]
MKDLYSLFEKYTGKEPANVNSLTGSASNRSYFRMSEGERSLMGVVGTDALENKAFITLAGH